MVTELAFVERPIRIKGSDSSLKYPAGIDAIEVETVMKLMREEKTIRAGNIVIMIPKMHRGPLRFLYRSRALNRNRKVPHVCPRCCGRNANITIFPLPSGTSTRAAFPFK